MEKAICNYIVGNIEGDCEFDTKEYNGFTISRLDVTPKNRILVTAYKDENGETEVVDVFVVKCYTENSKMGYGRCYNRYFFIISEDIRDKVDSVIKNLQMNSKCEVVYSCRDGAFDLDMAKGYLDTICDVAADKCKGTYCGRVR